MSVAQLDPGMSMKTLAALECYFAAPFSSYILVALSPFFKKTDGLSSFPKMTEAIFVYSDKEEAKTVMDLVFKSEDL